MRIWVDADACPGVIKDILFRAAERAGIELTLVANRFLRTPASQYIKTIQVPHGFDVADDKIMALVQGGDLVVTADIPLAASAVAKGARALNPRGELYTDANIGERLGMRDLMEELRSSGALTGGPAVFSKSDRQAFANQLDRLIASRPRA